MRKIGVGVFGILICAASCLCADGFSDADRDFLAEKGEFPGPDGGGDEGALPESEITTSSTESSCGKSDMKPEANCPSNE